MCLTTPPNKAATKSNCTYSKITRLYKNMFFVVTNFHHEQELGHGQTHSQGPSTQGRIQLQPSPAIRIFT